MRELLAGHWLIGGGLALAGGITYRLAPAMLDGGARITCQLVALAAVAVGLFTVARGVSRSARARETHSSKP